MIASKEIEVTNDEAIAMRETARVIEFLADPIIQGAIERIHKKYYEEFRAAASADKRMEAWAKAKSLDDFANELSVVKGRGEHAKASVQRRTPR